MKRRAVILLSGGLDSAVTLFYARSKGYACHPLTFDYGQRHRTEIGRAVKISKAAGTKVTLMKLRFPWKGSSLLDKTESLPIGRSIEKINSGIPSTYVPARNTVFLSLAASFAESIKADYIFIGAHSEDSSGYPDCRVGYLKAFNKVIRLGTRRGLEGRLELKFPLVNMTKRRIVKLGGLLGVPFEHTMSCYKGRLKPCMACDSCILRAKGFREALMRDPIVGHQAG